MLLCSIAGFSQHRHQLLHFTQNNGLPQNSVNSLFFTPGGFLWIATESGISRFNGYKFKNFTRQNSSLIDDERFKFIIPDAVGNLFTQTSKGNIYLIKENKLIPVGIGRYRYVLRGQIPALRCLSDSNWIIFSQTFLRLINLYPVSITSLGSGKYSIMGKNYLYLFHIRSQDIDSISLPAGSSQIFKAGHSYFLSTRQSEIFELDINNKQFNRIALPTSISNTEPFRIFVKHSSKKVYLLQGSRLFEITSGYSVSKLNFVLLINELPQDEIINDIDVYENVVAIGTLSNGVFIYKPSYFETLLPAAGQNTRVRPYYAITSDSKGNIYSTNGTVFSANGYQSLTLNDGRISPECIALHKDSLLYFGFADSLFIHNLITKKTALVRCFANYGNINAIQFISDTLYVASTNAVFILSGNQIIQTYTYPYRLNERINTLYPINSGRIYTGGCDGLFLLNRTKGVAEKLEIPEDVCVRSVLSTEKLLLIGTYGDGIWCLYNNKWIQLPGDETGCVMKTHAIVKDTKNRIWISTNNGLLKTNYQDIINYCDQNSISVNYTRYDNYDGIISTEFNGGCQPAFIYNTSANYICFPSMTGIVKFNPDSVDRTADLKHIYLDEIIADNKVIDSKKGIYNIPGGTTMVQINPVWTNWDNPYRSKVYYKSNNEDAIPQQLTMIESSFSLQSISKGNKTIRISTDIQSQAVNLNINLLVEPLYYETLWFRFLVLLVASILIWGFARLYNSYLHKRNQELETLVAQRTSELTQMNHTLSDYNRQLEESEKNLKQSIGIKNRLISIITHDIITPLRFIAMVARNTGKQANSTELLETLNDIQNTSMRLHENAQNILNWIKHQTNNIALQYTNIPLYALVEECTELLADAAFQSNVKLYNHVEFDKLLYCDRNVVSIIIQNIISNAVKYTRNTKVEISSDDINGYTLITIADYGAGMSAAMLSRIQSVLGGKQTYYLDDTSGGHGLGYVIIAELSQLIQSEITVTSNNSGTTVVIKIPENKR
jgi:signal transduction histidine kinase